MHPQFHDERLDDSYILYCGRLPDHLSLDAAQVNKLWDAHPQEFHEIMMHGKLVKTPRWQQAYGVDYHYTHRTNRAVSVLPILQPFLEWALQNVDDRLNGILVNGTTALEATISAATVTARRIWLTVPRL